MPRTEREQKANDAIEAALLEYRDAYAEAHPDVRVGTITDWIVVATELVAGEGGNPDDDVQTYAIIMPNGGIPNYRAVGLLKMGMHYTMPWEES